MKKVLKVEFKIEVYGRTSKERLKNYKELVRLFSNDFRGCAIGGCDGRIEFVKIKEEQNEHSK
jgi:hypothetical protein